MTSLAKFSRSLLLLGSLILGLAAREASAVPFSAGGVTVDVVATQSWSGGYNGAVRVTNNSYPAAITSFQVVFKLSGTAGIQGSGWNSTISAADASGNRTAKNAGWMSPIRAGTSWDEGFSGTGTFAGSTVVSVIVNGTPLSGTGTDTTSPVVSLASSATTVTAAGSITLTATATDNIGVVRVEFYDGVTLLASDTSAPYTQVVALTSANNGTHAYSAKAFDAASNAAISSAVSVVVNVQGGDPTPPTVSLTASPTSITAPGNVTLSATATDNVGVTKVEFYDGATLVGTDTTSPYSFVGAITSANNGTHSFTAKAYDAAGNTKTSTAVSVVVNIPTDIVPPTVSLTSSTTSVTVASTITLSAIATDNVGVTKVEFYDGTTLLGTDLSSPYSQTATVTSANNGTHTFTAKAYDAIGSVTTSAAVVVLVNIPTEVRPPSVTLASSASSVTTAGNLTLSATVTGTGTGGIVRVDFYDGLTLLGADTTAPYAWTVALSSGNNGTHSYTAKVYDAAGNPGTSSAVIVTVNISGSSGAPVYTAAGGKFLKDGVELKLYGLNWFGMETPTRVVHGLWTGRQMDDFLADFKSKGFNALRLPVSPQVINPGFAIDSGPYSGNDCAAMCGKDGRTALEYTLARMQAAGMYALIDYHTCNPANLGSGLPGRPDGCSGYTLSNWLADIATLTQLSKTYTNVIGIDLMNEPWALTWTAWADDASLGGQQVLSVNPNVTVWVEGIGNTSTAGVAGGANWGQNLYEAGSIAYVPANKLVYSPHSYGPSVANMSYFSAPNFPSNMPAIWDTLFGHLVGQGYTVVVGEFGGQYTGADKTWQDAFVSYLIGKGMKSSFYWCVNPNSGDTGGVLQGDWKTWNTDKLVLLQQLMK